MAPISFAIQEARDHLLQHGYVYTLRDVRSEGRSDLRWNRLGPSVGTVHVTFIREIHDDAELSLYVVQSGFETVEAWRAAAGDSRFLYYVVLLELKEAEK